MKPKENINNNYNKEETFYKVPNDGREEIDIEPIDWDDM